jgi:hypothetical protein
LETYSFFFKSSFATAEFRGCSCCEDKNITGSNQRPFELTQQTETMRDFTSHPAPDDRSTNQPGQRSRAIQLMMTAPLIASHPTPDDRSTNQPGQRSRAIQLMMTAPLITSLLVHTQHLMTAQLTVQWTPLPLRYH